MPPFVALLMVLGGGVSAIVGMTVIFGPWALVVGGLVVAGTGALLVQVAEVPSPAPGPPSPYDDEF